MLQYPPITPRRTSLFVKKPSYLAERRLGSFHYVVNPITLALHRLDSRTTLIWDLINETSTINTLYHEYVHASQGTPETAITLERFTSFLEILQRLHLIHLTSNTHEPYMPVHSHEDSQTFHTQLMLDRNTSRDTNVLDEMWSTAASQHVILKADLEITYGCNHKCLHCYNTIRREKVLTTQQIIDVIDQLAEQGCLFLALTGGEVFTRPDAMIIAQHARLRQFSIRILTNGSLVTNQLADQLADLHPEAVEVTLCGTRAETHDSFVQFDGSFRKVINALRLLGERQINTYIKYVFTKYNVDEAHSLPALAHSLGIDYIYSRPHLFPTADGNNGPTVYRVTDEQLQKLVQLGIFSQTRQRCYAGVARCSISPWGEVHPCEVLPHSFGNVKIHEVRDIWRESDKTLWESDAIRHPLGCTDCRYEDICGRCPAMSYLDDGSLTVPASQACRLSKMFKGKPNSYSGGTHVCS